MSAPRSLGVRRALRVLGRAADAGVEEFEAAMAPAFRGDPASAARWGHRLFNEAEERSRRVGDAEPACAAGCSYCCHVHVDASRPEVLAVASYLEASLTADQLSAFRARLADHVDKVDVLSDEERWGAGIPCALLDEGGRCSVHPARPFRCRAFESPSADLCRRAFEGEDVDVPRAAPRRARALASVEEGYDRALAREGIDPTPVRLEAALLTALARP